MNAFQRFALQMSWDFSEANALHDSGGTYLSQLDWIGRYVEHALGAACAPVLPCALMRAASHHGDGSMDVVITDPPYYDAIPYSDLMDFFYVWLRRTLHGHSREVDEAFCACLSPKWDHAANDGELIDDPSRFGGDKSQSRRAYEEGMYAAFRACYGSLRRDGRLVIVFAHKQPDAWETLVFALIRAGFVVDASWPIQTEMANRTRAMSSAALSSSVWLVCRKRPEGVRPGWDGPVLAEMREKITLRLREFWDAGIRGPDFVWAATGPALEAYSRYPVVRKADEPGQVMTISEFLAHVRRMVVDFVVGRLLSPAGDGRAADLDDVTTYYLLHRHTFGFAQAPVGACILYALSCGLSEQDLVTQYDLLTYAKGGASVEQDPEEAPDDEEEELHERSRATLRLNRWHQRRRKSLGYTAPRGRPVPLIDRVHRLMHLWRAGEVAAVDDYLKGEALLANALFHQVLQALIELEPNGNGDRSLLESISNHLPAPAQGGQVIG
ncbi:MAG: hypothetical protein QME94_14585, partial [Anaerolineae bacterium]|nr:hypothetical protein [Anaerolineae bacterium]